MRQEERQALLHVSCFLHDKVLMGKNEGNGTSVTSIKFVLDFPYCVVLSF